MNCCTSPKAGAPAIRRRARPALPMKDEAAGERAAQRRRRRRPAGAAGARPASTRRRRSGLRRRRRQIQAARRAAGELPRQRAAYGQRLLQLLEARTAERRRAMPVNTSTPEARHVARMLGSRRAGRRRQQGRQQEGNIDGRRNRRTVGYRAAGPAARGCGHIAPGGAHRQQAAAARAFRRCRRGLPLESASRPGADVSSIGLRTASLNQAHGVYRNRPRASSRLAEAAELFQIAAFQEVPARGAGTRFYVMENNFRPVAQARLLEGRCRRSSAAVTARGRPVFSSGRRWVGAICVLRWPAMDVGGRGR